MPLTGLKVLLLDDDLLTLELYEFILRSKNAEVRKATSVAGAFEILRNWVPDLIVSDIGLPDENGADFIRKLRLSEQNKDIPIIALTGYGSLANEGELRKAGCSVILTKPIDPDTFLLTVEEIFPS
jgi:CheY-like chemotaxis protein